MKTKSYLFTSFLALFILVSYSAVLAKGINVTGAGEIAGNIRCTSNNEFLENVSITLFSASDSAMIAGTITDRFGNFNLSMLGTGIYYIEFSGSGIKKQSIQNLDILLENPKVNLGAIYLNCSAKSHKKHKK